MKMKKILLYDASLPGFQNKPANYWLKAYAVKFKEIRGNFEIILRHLGARNVDFKKEMEFIKKSRPVAIGASCYVWDFDRLRKLLKKTRRERPEIVTIIGGPESCPELLEENPFIDIAVLQDGERKFYELLLWLDGRKELEKIGGITYRKNGLVVKNAEPVEKTKLSELPSPFLSGVMKPKQILFLELDRGCPFHCSYCNWGNRKGVDFFPMKRIKEEIDFAVENGLSIKLGTGNCNLNEERTIEVLRYLGELKRKGKNVKVIWFLFINYQLPFEKIIPAIGGTNLGFIMNIGIQTINEETTKNIKRTLNIKRLKRMLKLMRKNKVSHKLQFMTGLPGDDFFDVARVVKFAIEEGCIDFVPFHTVVLRGTALRDDAEKFKIKFRKKGAPFMISNYSFSEEGIKKAKLMSSFERWEYLAGSPPIEWEKHKARWE